MRRAYAQCFSVQIRSTIRGTKHREDVSKRQGWGEEILLGAFQKAKEINEISAIQAVVVNTLNANAEAFYRVYGFVKIGDTNKMIISTKELFD